MANLWYTAFDRYAFRRVRRRTSTDAFQTCDAGRARVHLPSEAGTPDMTIRRPAADRTGARPISSASPHQIVGDFPGLSQIDPFVRRRH
jgi:hypothetical protein